MPTQTFSVPDISCDHCRTAIEGEVGAVAGVTTVEVDIEARTVTVTGDVRESAVRAAVEVAGYEAAPGVLTDEVAPPSA